MPCSCRKESSYWRSSKTQEAPSIMARRCRRMVVLAFLTHASFELCGFVGSWRAKGEGAPMRPMTLGVKAFDPAAGLGAASAAASLFDFISRQLSFFTSMFLQVELLPSGGKVGAHVEKLAGFVDRAQQEGGSIILQGQVVPEQPVEGTGFIWLPAVDDHSVERRPNRWSLCCECGGGGRQVYCCCDRLADPRLRWRSGITRRSLQSRCCCRATLLATSKTSSGLHERVKLCQLLWSCFVS